MKSGNLQLNSLKSWYAPRISRTHSVHDSTMILIFDPSSFFFVSLRLPKFSPHHISYEYIELWEENIGSIQSELCLNPDMRLPDVLFQQRHTIPGNTNASEDLRLTTAIVNGAHCQVYEFINHLYLIGPNIHHLFNWANVSITLNFGCSPVHLQAKQRGLLTLLLINHYKTM